MFLAQKLKQRCQGSSTPVVLSLWSQAKGPLELLLATSLVSLPVPGIKDVEPVEVDCREDETCDHADYRDAPHEIKDRT